MLDKKTLNTKISDAMKDIIADRQAKSGLTDPVPNISFGRWRDELEEYYALAMYERSRIPINEDIRYIDIDGIEFLIIQDWLCKELDGKLIDVVNGRLTILNCPN